MNLAINRKSTNIFMIFVLLFSMVFSNLGVLVANAITSDDVGGNVCLDDSNPIEVEKVRLNAPTITHEITDWARQVTVTIDYDATSVSKFYSLDYGTTWLEYTAPFVLTQNSTIYAYSTKDYVKSERTVHQVTNIDYITGPGVSVQKVLSGQGYGSINYENAIVTLTKYKTEDSLFYSTDGTTWVEYTSPITVLYNDMDVTYQFKAVSPTGLERVETREFKKSNHERIELPPLPSIPEPELEFTVTQSPTSLTNGDVVVTITLVQDNEYADFIANNGGAGSFVVQETSNVTVDTSYVPNFGEVRVIVKRNAYVNFSFKNTRYTFSDRVYVSNIDKDAPNVVATVSKSDGLAKVSFSVNETATIEYSLDGGTTWLEYTNSFVEVDSPTTIKYRATDLAGNESDVRDVVVTISHLDITPPDEPTYTFNVAEEILTNDNVIVTVNYSADSVVKKYSFDRVTWYDYTEPLVIEQNTFIYAYAQDEAGNQSSTVTTEVYNINKNVEDCNGKVIEFCMDENGNDLTYDDGTKIPFVSTEDCEDLITNFCMNTDGAIVLGEDGLPKPKSEGCDPVPPVEYCKDSEGNTMLDSEGNPIVKVTDDDCVVTPPTQYCLDDEGNIMRDVNGNPIVKVTDDDCEYTKVPPVEYCKDANGDTMLDSEGNPIVKVTDEDCNVAPPINYCVDEDGEVILDGNGNPIVPTHPSDCIIDSYDLYCKDVDGRVVLDEDGRPVLKTDEDCEPIKVVEYCKNADGTTMLDKDGKPIVKVTQKDCVVEPTVEYCLDIHGYPLLDENNNKIIKVTEEECSVTPPYYCLDKDGNFIIGKDGKPLVISQSDNCKVEDEEKPKTSSICIDENGYVMNPQYGYDLVKDKDGKCTYMDKVVPNDTTTTTDRDDIPQSSTNSNTIWFILSGLFVLIGGLLFRKSKMTN